MQLIIRYVCIYIDTGEGKSIVILRHTFFFQEDAFKKIKFTITIDYIISFIDFNEQIITIIFHVTNNTSHIMRLRVLYGFDGRTATGVIWTCTCITYYMYTANLNVKAIYNREASLPKTSLIFTPVTLRTLVGFMLHSDSFRGFFYFSCIWQLHKCT